MNEEKGERERGSLGYIQRERKDQLIRIAILKKRILYER